MDNSGHGPARPAEVPPEVPAEVTARTLPGEVAEIVGEISEATSPSRRRKLTAAIPRLARRSGRATWFGVQSGSRWLTAEGLAMAPRLPVRDQLTLRAQFPGLTPEELADALIQGSARAAGAVGAAAGAAMVLPLPTAPVEAPFGTADALIQGWARAAGAVGAAAGAAMVLPLPTAPVEVAIETLALVGIEIKLVAELHEVYGQPASGPPSERMLSYVAAWAHRRGVGLAPGGLALAVGSPLRRRLQRRLLARAGRSATSFGPLLTGAVVGAALNRRETRRLGADVRDDLRRRSPQATHWPS